MRRWDWGLLLAIALALVAAWPFLTRPGLPRQTDAELHVYRAAELGHMLRAGAFYPRWASDLFLGYGYPIFHYYAPLTYYLANLFDLLPGVGIVGGVKAVFILGFFFAALGAYLLGRELFGRAAGVVASASFTFAPYVVFIDPHARGDLAEHLAVCVLPLAFYAFRRLMSGQGGRWALLGSATTLALIVFSHNLLGLVSACLLFAYWLWEVAASRAGRRRAGWGMLAFLLAAVDLAFFWLPFVMERGAIKLQVVGPGHFDFHEHFLSVAELLGPSRVLDWGATAPHYRLNLGLAQWVLALPALAALALAVRRKSRSGRPDLSPLGYFVLAALVLVLLMLPLSASVWERVPGMAYLQFPWRLLGPANLMLAVCAAGGASLLSNRRWSGPVLATALAMILATALPALYPPPWGPDFGGATPSDIIAWEQESLAFGTTSTGDFLPKQAMLGVIYPTQSLIESYARPGPVDRVNRITLPAGAAVEIVEQRALYDRFAVVTPEAFVMRLYLLYFPGWHVYVDGQEVEIEVAGPEGFITFWTPAGAHEVVARFEDTPPRTAGWILSTAGLIVTALAFAAMRAPVEGARGATSDWRWALWMGSALLVFAGFKLAVADHVDWFHRTSPPGEAWPAQRALRADFGRQIELLGYDVFPQRVRPGDTLTVVLYWRALTPVEVDYQSFVHIVDPQDVRRVLTQGDHLNPGGLPTTRWPLDRYVWDEFEIPIPHDAPTGEYALNVGIYSLAGDYRLERYGEDGQAVGDSMILGSVVVE